MTITVRFESVSCSIERQIVIPKRYWANATQLARVLDKVLKAAEESLRKQRIIK